MHGEPTQTGPMIQHDMTRRHPEQAPTVGRRNCFPDQRQLLYSTKKRASLQLRRRHLSTK